MCIRTPNALATIGLLVATFGLSSNTARASTPPGTTIDLARVLDASAALVSATLVRKDFSTAPDGPVTTYHFGSVAVLLGNFAPGDFAVEGFGGPLPDGSEVNFESSPDLHPGRAYVFFLRSTPWRVTPFMGPVIEMGSDPNRPQAMLVPRRGCVLVADQSRPGSAVRCVAAGSATIEPVVPITLSELEDRLRAIASDRPTALAREFPRSRLLLTEGELRAE